MGTRWAWTARCRVCGQNFSGFSGGADPCYACGSEDVVETTLLHGLPVDTKDRRIEELEAEVKRLRAKIDAALALHYTERKYGAEVCAECGNLWPCPTVKSLKGEEE